MNTLGVVIASLSHFDKPQGVRLRPCRKGVSIRGLIVWWRVTAKSETKKFAATKQLQSARMLLLKVMVISIEP
jgi:hypothetical protein